MDPKAKVISILKYAQEMELAGRDFYEDKGKAFASPTTRNMFQELADTEQEHYDLITSELNAYTADPASFVVSDAILARDESNIFQRREGSESLDTTLVESDVPDLTVMRMAYLIERDYKEFYEEAIDMVEEENVKLLLKRLSDWELGHERLFKKEYDRLKKEYLTFPWGG